MEENNNNIDNNSIEAGAADEMTEITAAGASGEADAGGAGITEAAGGATDAGGAGITEAAANGAGITETANGAGITEAAAGGAEAAGAAPIATSVGEAATGAKEATETANADAAEGGATGAGGAGITEAAGGEAANAAPIATSVGEAAAGAKAATETANATAEATETAATGNTDEDNIDKRTDRVKTISIICLAVCLLITIIAWAASYVKVTGNTIQFGKIDIEIGYFDNGNRQYFAPDDGKNLFDGSTIFEGEGEVVLVPQGRDFPEPRTDRVRSEERTFFIENKGNLDAWYSIYLDNTSGTFGYVLRVYIDEMYGDGSRAHLFGYDEPVFAIDLTKENYGATHIGALMAGESKTLALRFEIDDERFERFGTDTCFEFDICVDAVQMRNNP